MPSHASSTNDHFDEDKIKVIRPKSGNTEQGSFTLSGRHADLVSNGYAISFHSEPLAQLAPHHERRAQLNLPKVFDGDHSMPQRAKLAAGTVTIAGVP
jgi:hypothetical protein